jgi:ribosomal protein L7/L12
MNFKLVEALCKIGVDHKAPVLCKWVIDHVMSKDEVTFLEKALFESGEKFSAARLMKERTGLGLIDSKEVLEKCLLSQSKETPKIQQDVFIVGIVDTQDFILVG